MSHISNELVSNSMEEGVAGGGSVIGQAISLIMWGLEL